MFGSSKRQAAYFYCCSSVTGFASPIRRWRPARERIEPLVSLIQSAPLASRWEEILIGQVLALSAREME
jgi:hypothetical protein